MITSSPDCWLSFFFGRTKILLIVTLTFMVGHEHLGAENHERQVVAYVGYLFNMSLGNCTKVSLPNWIHCQRRHILGLPLDRHYGRKFIFAFSNRTTYTITVEYCHPWWHKLAKNEVSHLFVSGLQVQRDTFLKLNAVGRIKLIEAIRIMMGLNMSQDVVAIQSDRISGTISYVATSSSNIRGDMMTIIWSVGEDLISNVSLKSLQVLEARFSTTSLTVSSINIKQWFVGLIRKRRRLHFHRSVDLPESETFIEGSGYSSIRKANEFLRTPGNYSDSSGPNETLSQPVVLSSLLPIKMNALQIMNYVIPENTFENKNSQAPLRINAFFENNSMVSSDPTRWISFNRKDQNIRFNPKLLNIGETILKICAYRSVINFVCEKLSISVSAPPPQNHQIYVTTLHKGYVIRYTIPLAWFKRFGVRLRKDIYLENATGNSPFDWDRDGNLQILDIASLEGKLIELILKVSVRNESQISIHLTLPVVAINRQRITSGPLFRSQVTFKPDNQFQEKTNFKLSDFFEMLKQLATFIGKYLEDTSIKVQIFSPLKSPLFFNKVPGRPGEVVIFDWFFHSDNGSKKLCSNQLLEKIDKVLLWKSFSSFLMTNLTVIEQRFGWGCPFPTNETSPKKDSDGPNVTPSNELTDVDAKLKADEDIVLRCFPNWKFTNFTVTAGMPFKSYIFRKNHADKSKIKKMQLEHNLDPGTEAWIALSVNNDFLFGLPLQKDVRQSGYKLRFSVVIFNSTIEYKVLFLVSVVDFDRTSKALNHEVRMAIKIDKKVQTDLDYRWKLVTRLDMYVREKCETSKDCGKDLVLQDFNVASSPTNSSSSNVTATFSFLSILLMDGRYCPKLSLILLYDKLCNIVSSSNLRKPNFAMKYLFLKSNLGEVVDCEIIVSGVCKGVELQPPDLGQITIFAMVPFQQSLRQLCIFYNTTVWFTIVAEGSPKDINLYHDWISVNEESTSLVGIALLRNVRADPYILELIVHSNTVRQLISPRIAVTVRDLKEHPLYKPYIHQPNHQILAILEFIPRLSPDRNYLLFKFLFSKLTDKYFRPDCHKNEYFTSTSPVLPCGSNLVFQNISKIGNSDAITFKFSIISELIGVRSKVKSPTLTMNGYQQFCPIEKLIKVQRGLLGDNGSATSPAVLPSVIHYYYKANLGKIKSIKFEFLGPCSKYQYFKGNEVGGLMKATQNQPKAAREDRHMFLVTTIVPTCSFIIISLCVGLLVACCLQRRNQKFQSNLHSNRASVEFAVRGGMSPIILAGEYQSSYMPPSRPLILPNEKPPVPPPDYIGENHSLIITDEDA